jgi:hypothetical protein
MAGPWWQSGARGRRIEEMSTSWLRRTLVDREVEILSADHDEEFRTQFAAVAGGRTAPHGVPRRRVQGLAGY